MKGNVTSYIFICIHSLYPGRGSSRAAAQERGVRDIAAGHDGRVPRAGQVHGRGRGDGRGGHPGETQILSIIVEKYVIMMI